ncbi:uncharacterized protein [Aegilops tauschii subsp. strangulata]|uniref:uncharacterized protein n=1 Tax=Aegilops tauschii subsp. strangulata TaxID=200361 RepID=UPI003CC843B2
MSLAGSVGDLGGDRRVMSGLLAQFTQEHRFDCHGGRTIRTVYTNEISVVDTWIQESEAYMRAYELVFIGIDLEYTPSHDSAIVIQLCDDSSYLVYQVFQSPRVSTSLRKFLLKEQYTFIGLSIWRDKELLELLGLRVTNYKDIQAEWAVPDASNKPLNSLREVSGLIIDEFYDKMKNLFDKEYHQH